MLVSITIHHRKILIRVKNLINERFDTLLKKIMIKYEQVIFNSILNEKKRI